MDFNIGQIFEGSYPSQVADWCNAQGNCFVEELQSTDGIRRFEIKSIPQLGEEELRANEIKKLKNELAELDLKSIRALRAGDTQYIEKYESQAVSLREKLTELIK